MALRKRERLQWVTERSDQKDQARMRASACLLYSTIANATLEYSQIFYFVPGAETDNKDPSL